MNPLNLTRILILIFKIDINVILYLFFYLYFVRIKTMLNAKEKKRVNGTNYYQKNIDPIQSMGQEILTNDSCFYLNNSPHKLSDDLKQIKNSLAINAKAKL